jgi:hypothetical protein
VHSTILAAGERLSDIAAGPRGSIRGDNGADFEGDLSEDSAFNSMQQF